MSSSLSNILGGSASAYDLAHVQSLVETMAVIAADHAGGSLRLHGMTLPFDDPSDGHDGFMELFIEKEGRAPLAFGIEFGAQDMERRTFPEMTLEMAMEAAEHGDTATSMATASNFDELWLAINQLTQRLAISRITLAFGGLGGL